MVKKAATPKEPKAPKAEKPNPAIVTPEKGVTAKAVWTGYLSAFGLMTIPVKSYKAADTDKIERNMYHSATCVNKLKYQSMICSGCNAEVAKGQEVYGVTVEGKVILVSDDEMNAQKPANEESLNVLEFVPVESINVIYYESSEYLACGDTTTQLQEVFANFRDGLKLSGRVAIGRIVSRGHEYYVAIRPYSNGLVMSYLFAEYEVRECTKWTAVASNPSHAQTFAQLMSESEDYSKDVFTPASYDSYLKNVRNMIAKKAAGETVECPKPQEAPKAATDLMAALQATLNQAKKKAAAARAGK